MYTVYVEYFYEGDTHHFDNLKEAEECYDNYCKCANTIVELRENGKLIKSNNKEYLR